MAEYYVYKHIRLKDGSTFYIGKGTGDRFSSEAGRNVYWNRIVRKDGGFNVEIVAFGLTNQAACDLEIKLINEIGLDNLANLAEGGQGGNTRKGFTEEQLQKWKDNKSKAQTGKTSYWKGKVRPEHSLKIKEAANRGAYKDNGKFKKSDETRRRMSESARKPKPRKPCEVCGRSIATTHFWKHICK